MLEYVVFRRKQHMLLLDKYGTPDHYFLKREGPLFRKKLEQIRGRHWHQFEASKLGDSARVENFLRLASGCSHVYGQVDKADHTPTHGGFIHLRYCVSIHPKQPKNYVNGCSATKRGGGEVC